MSLTQELYDLWKRMESLETHQSFREREAREAAQQRDALLVLCRQHQLTTEDAECRHCGAPMSLEPWAKQYCHHCRGD